jgi:hypothetical protein
VAVAHTPAGYATTAAAYTSPATDLAVKLTFDQVDQDGLREVHHVGAQAVVTQQLRQQVLLRNVDLCGKKGGGTDGVGWEGSSRLHQRVT